MGSDPTLPARLAALGFRVGLHGGRVRWRDPAPGGQSPTEPDIDHPGTYDAAVRFVAGLLKGKRVPCQPGLVNDLLAIGVPSADIAAVHLAGLAWGVAMAEDIATRGDTPTGTE